MLVITIELRSAVTGETSVLGVGHIVNDGTGSAKAGNYRVELYDKGGNLWRHGRIEHFPRQKRLAWDLLAWALEAIVGVRS